MLLRIIMYYDPTLSVLLYSIQNCFFLSSSEGSLLFCNFFFGFFLVWIRFTAEIHFSVLFLLDVARVVGGFQTRQRLPRARPLQCEQPCRQKSLPLPDLALSFWSLPSGVMGWSCFGRECTASSVASKDRRHFLKGRESNEFILVLKARDLHDLAEDYRLQLILVENDSSQEDEDSSKNEKTASSTNGNVARRELLLPGRFRRYVVCCFQC